MDYKPPIRERTTDQLISIIEKPEEWNPDVVEIAQDELVKRGVSLEIQNLKRKNKAKYIQKIKGIKNKATYSALEKCLIVIFGPLLIIIFNDFFAMRAGEEYKKKNRQGLIYSILGFVFWAILLLLFI